MAEFADQLAQIIARQNAQMQNPVVAAAMPVKVQDRLQEQIDEVREQMTKQNAMMGQLIAVLSGGAPFANQVAPVGQMAPVVQAPVIQAPKVQAPASVFTPVIPPVDPSVVIPPVPAGKKGYAEAWVSLIRQMEPRNAVSERTGKRYVGVHTTIPQKLSNGKYDASFNDYMMHYYGFTDKNIVYAITSTLAAQGVIEVGYAKRGYRIALPGTFAAAKQQNQTKTHVWTPAIQL